MAVGTMTGRYTNHLLAKSNPLQDLVTRSDGKALQIKVIGWNQLSGTARRDFIRNISDHSMLVGKV